MELKLTEFLGLEIEASSEQILKKIHLKRLKNELPKFVEDYLEKTFFETNDVRFFNELLWLGIDGNQKSIEHFNQNFINGKYLYCFDKDLKFCLNINSSNFHEDKYSFSNNSIALIGNPFHFVFAFRKFKKKNIDVDIINVKYHPSKIQKTLFFNSFISLLYRCYFKSSYREIRVENKKALNKVNIEKEYDVGFHKLSFIISNNIISKFRKGLINDHWGALPLFKGRSTLMYSKLFGANLTITNHLITKEIDSGKILLFTNINPRSIRKEIYFGLADRVYNSIALLCNDEFVNLDNKQGYTFYEMHPWLINKIKK